MYLNHERNLFYIKLLKELSQNSKLWIKIIIIFSINFVSLLLLLLLAIKIDHTSICYSILYVFLKDQKDMSLSIILFCTFLLKRDLFRIYFDIFRIEYSFFAFCLYILYLYIERILFFCLFFHYVIMYSTSQLCF